MNWETILQYILTIIGAMGGVGVVLVGLLIWVGRVWENALLNRLSARQAKELEELRNKYTFELETLRSDITDRRDALANTSSALSSSYMASHSHIIEAINTLWLTILEIDRSTEDSLFIYAVLLPNEIESLDPSQYHKFFQSPIDEDISLKALEIMREVELKRPFIGENLWKLFSIYRTFALRLSLKLNEGRKLKKLYSWNKDFSGNRDEALYSAIYLIYSEKEIEEITKFTIGAPQLILNGIKIRILSEMNEMIFGKHLISMNISEQQRINVLLNNLKSTSQKEPNSGPD